MTLQKRLYLYDMHEDYQRHVSITIRLCKKFYSMNSTKVIVTIKLRSNLYLLKVIIVEKIGKYILVRLSNGIG